MTSKAKRLGTGLEDRVVKKAGEKGLPARKQPGSGVYKSLPNDVVLGEAHRTLAECKVRSVEIDAKGQRTFRVDMGWWSGVQKNADKDGFAAAALVMNAKYSDAPMALIPLDDYLELLKAYEELEKLAESNNRLRIADMVMGDMGYPFR